MPNKHLDLRLIIELYYGQYPVTSNNQKISRRIEAEEGSFCSIYVRNDLPDDFHNRIHRYMIAKLSRLQKEKGINGIKPGSFWPFYTYKNNPNQIVQAIPGPTPEKLKNSIMRAGGLFFTPEIATCIINEYEKLGYEIEKKY